MGSKVSKLISRPVKRLKQTIAEAPCFSTANARARGLDIWGVSLGMIGIDTRLRTKAVVAASSFTRSLPSIKCTPWGQERFSSTASAPAFNSSCCLLPAFFVEAVDAGNNGNRQALFCLANQLRVAIQIPFAGLLVRIECCGSHPTMA